LKVISVAALALWATGARAQNAVTTGGDSFNLNGYSSFEFEKQLTEDGEGDRNGSFDADLFDLVLNWRANERLRVAADVTWEHGSATEDGRGNVALEYGFAEYTVADALKIRAGKMFTPFGLYNEIHTAKPAMMTVKEPFSTNRTNKWGTPVRLYPRWLTGVGLYGNGSCPAGDWDYALVVSNGEQYVYDGGLDVTGNPFEEDADKEKAITARLRLATIGNLKVGLSGYFDTSKVFDPSLGTDGDYATGTLRQTAYGLSLEWMLPEPAIGVEVEVVGADFQASPGLKDAIFASTGDVIDTATTLGATAMVYWHATDAITPYARFEYLNPDDDIDDDVTTLILAGVNWRVGGGLVVKVEGDYTNAQKATAWGVDNGDKALSFFEVKAAAVVGF
jgi:hypothetical protein